MASRNWKARPQLVSLDERAVPAANGFIGVGGTEDGVSTTFFYNGTSTKASQGTTFQWFGTDSDFLVREAVGDINGDTTPDVAIVAGPGGGSLIGLVNGAGGDPLTGVFSAFEPAFDGGLYHTVGDIDGNGTNELVIAPDTTGGPRVQIYSWDQASSKLVLRDNFFGIDDPNFRGGARVALADLNGDNKQELVVAAGFGGGPRVAVFNGTGLLQNAASPPKLVGDFFAFPGADAATLRNGVFVAGGDFTADGKDDLAFGGGPGGGPRVFVISGASILANGVASAQASPIANYFVGGDANSRGGVRPLSVDIDADNNFDLAVGSGDGRPTTIRTYLGRTLAQSNGIEPPLAQSFDPFASRPTGALSATGQVTVAVRTSPNGVYVG